MGVVGRIYIYYLELFCKEEVSLWDYLFVYLFIYLFTHLFTLISTHVCLFYTLGKILYYLFLLSKLFELWPLGTVLGLLLCAFDLTHPFFFFFLMYFFTV